MDKSIIVYFLIMTFTNVACIGFIYKNIETKKIKELEDSNSKLWNDYSSCGLANDQYITEIRLMKQRDEDARAIINRDRRNNFIVVDHSADVKRLEEEVTYQKALVEKLKKELDGEGEK